MFISSHRIHGKCVPRPGRIIGLLLVAVCFSAAAGCQSFMARGQMASGVRAYDQGRLEEAQTQFLQATYTDPTNPDGFYNLAATHHRVGTMQGRRENIDQAEQYYRMCLDKDKNHRDAHRGLAVLMIEQGRSNEAFELVEGWTESQPDSSQAWTELARLHQDFSDHGSAEDYLAKALEIDPYNTRARAAIGKIHEDRGEFALAMRNYQHSLQANHLQPHVALRLAALRSRTSLGTETTPPAGGTRMVGRGSMPIR